jgi:hypothetical protein
MERVQRSGSRDSRDVELIDRVAIELEIHHADIICLHPTYWESYVFIQFEGILRRRIAKMT